MFRTAASATTIRTCRKFGQPRSVRLPSQKRTFFAVIENYQRGLVFRAGKHSGEKEPGIRWSFPVFNEVRKVDMRTHTMQIPSQELITKDNVTIHVDAVAFYGIFDAVKSLW